MYMHEYKFLFFFMDIQVTLLYIGYNQILKLLLFYMFRIKKTFHSIIILLSWTICKQFVHIHSLKRTKKKNNYSCYESRFLFFKIFCDKFILKTKMKKDLSHRIKEKKHTKRNWNRLMIRTNLIVVSTWM